MQMRGEGCGTACERCSMAGEKPNDGQGLARREEPVPSTPSGDEKRASTVTEWSGSCTASFERRHADTSRPATSIIDIVDIGIVDIGIINIDIVGICTVRHRYRRHLHRPS
ncbi:hypothetical protein RJ55_04472 [Drechmeria coniospora]|nr:hypothetical protein RJ55_04472 [Drechmeria coniospora]